MQGFVCSLYHIIDEESINGIGIKIYLNIQSKIEDKILI